MCDHAESCRKCAYNLYLAEKFADILEQVEDIDDMYTSRHRSFDKRFPQFNPRICKDCFEGSTELSECNQCRQETCLCHIFRCKHCEAIHCTKCVGYFAALAVSQVCVSCGEERCRQCMKFKCWSCQQVACGDCKLQCECLRKGPTLEGLFVSST